MHTQWARFSDIYAYYMKHLSYTIVSYEKNNVPTCPWSAR